MSRRHGVGLAAFEHRASLSTSYAAHGANLRDRQSSSLQAQIEVFQSLLHHFALEHDDTIRADPAFRSEFARMCSAMGVDPLAGQNAKSKNAQGNEGVGKSRWSNFASLVNLGSGQRDNSAFVNQIASRLVEICRSRSAANGGLIPLEDCRLLIEKGSGLGSEIAVKHDDMVQAVKALTPLGSGYSIVQVGHQAMIRSLPSQLNQDQATVLAILHALGSTHYTMLEVNLNWQKERAQTVLQDLLVDGLVWLDQQGSSLEAPELFWSPMQLNDDDV